MMTGNAGGADRIAADCGLDQLRLR